MSFLIPGRSYPILLESLLSYAMSPISGLFRSLLRLVQLCVCTSVFLVALEPLNAQQTVQSVDDLPDAPTTSSSSAHPNPLGKEDVQGPNIHGWRPWVPIKPQTAAQKFGAATQASFSYPSLVSAAAGAGIAQAQDFYPEFHQGGAGFGRYLWHGVADQAVNNYTTTFLMPVLLHQDSRYYRLGYGNVWKRSAYSLSRIWITRSDQGEDECNISEILGSGVAASISSTFYPERQRTFAVVGQRWAGNIGGDALGLLLKEFSPEIGTALGNVVPFRRHRRSDATDSESPQPAPLP